MSKRLGRGRTCFQAGHSNHILAEMLREAVSPGEPRLRSWLPTGVSLGRVCHHSLPPWGIAITPTPRGSCVGLMSSW